MQATVPPFASYNAITSEHYNKIKVECEERGEGAWELQKQEWRDALIRADDDDMLPLDALQAEIMLYFDKILAQQQDLVRLSRLPVAVVANDYDLGNEYSQQRACRGPDPRLQFRVLCPRTVAVCHRRSCPQTIP